MLKKRRYISHCYGALAVIPLISLRCDVAQFVHKNKIFADRNEELDAEKIGHEQGA